MPGARCSAEADALIPVPCIGAAMGRRFNQSALLAEVIANASGRTVVHGRSSASRPRHSRSGWTNPPGAKCARRLPRAAGRQARGRGRKLVLIDDVLTSGATIDACARTLLRAGAERVDVLVFARVVAGGRTPI